MIDTTTGPRTLWEKTYDGHEFRITAYPNGAFGCPRVITPT